jgi:hypothetical protein
MITSDSASFAYEGMRRCSPSHAIPVPSSTTLRFRSKYDLVSPTLVQQAYTHTLPKPNKPRGSRRNYTAARSAIVTADQVFIHTWVFVHFEF